MKKIIFILCFLIVGGILLVLQYQKTSRLPLVTAIWKYNPATAYKTGVLNPNPSTPNLEKNNLSMESIFHYVDPAEDRKNNNSNEYTIFATGDVIPARSVNAKMVRLKNFNYPFEKTVNLLRNADLLLINLESPLIPNCQITEEGMEFCGDPRDVGGLVYAGVRVANIANNHSGNFGAVGINGTIHLLKENNIEATGNGQPAIVTVKGKRFGFLGYNSIGAKEAGIAWADIPQIQTDIQSLKKQVDFVIVSFHWGIEYTSNPTGQQQELAHMAIDAGADLIIGNHPHWVQGIEEYKNRLITYAHGNFVFDQMWSEETRQGVVGKYTFNNAGLIDVKFFPVVIDDYSQPRFATEMEAGKILSIMKESSLQIQIK